VESVIRFSGEVLTIPRGPKSWKMTKLIQETSISWIGNILDKVTDVSGSTFGWHFIGTYLQVLMLGTIKCFVRHIPLSTCGRWSLMASVHIGKVRGSLSKVKEYSGVVGDDCEETQSHFKDITRSVDGFWTNIRKDTFKGMMKALDPERAATGSDNEHMV
jgi:hypothetical protein